MSNGRLFPMSSSIYLIPHWVIETLHRHDMQTSDVLCLPKLRKVLSMNDLCSIEMLTSSFGEKVLGERESPVNSILYEWSATSLSEEDKVFFNQQVRPLTDDPYQKEQTAERLFGKTAETGNYAKPFEVVPLEDKAIGVIVYPGYFVGAKAREYHFSVIRALLKQLYVYEQHSAVAASLLTRSYLKHLSTQAV